MFLNRIGIIDDPFIVMMQMFKTAESTKIILGEKSLCLLECFILGMLDEAGQENEVKGFKEFESFVLEKHGDTCRGKDIFQSIRDQSYDDITGVDDFFSLFYEFMTQYYILTEEQDNGNKKPDHELYMKYYRKEELTCFAKTYLKENFDEIVYYPIQYVKKESEKCTLKRYCMEYPDGDMVCALYDDCLITYEDIQREAKRQRHLQAGIRADKA